jgi:hypothetical protein
VKDNLTNEEINLAYIGNIINDLPGNLGGQLLGQDIDKNIGGTSNLSDIGQ